MGPVPRPPPRPRRAYFEQRDMAHLYHDHMAWTVIQDAEALDGADITETSRRFREWIEGPGIEEMRGTALLAGKESPYCPRYRYSLHVDEENWRVWEGRTWRRSSWT